MRITGYVVVSGASLFGPFMAIEEASRALTQVAKGNASMVSIRPIEELVLPSVLAGDALSSRGACFGAGSDWKG